METKVTHTLSVDGGDIELYVPAILIAFHHMNQSMVPVITPKTVAVDDPDKVLSTLLSGTLMEKNKELIVTNQDEKLFFTRVDLEGVEATFNRVAGTLEFSYITSLELVVKKFRIHFDQIFNTVHHDLSIGNVTGQYSISSKKV